MRATITVILPFGKIRRTVAAAVITGGFSAIPDGITIGFMATEDDSLFTYAQRLLNPFRGVVNVIRYRSAEAVTMDGLHWDIYVANDSLSAGLGRRAQISDIRYGSWSEASGLKRGPLYPSEDFRRMEAQGHVVYEYLCAHHGEVPFAFVDCYERWLLDANDQPLALLNSALTEEEARAETGGGASSPWRAGFAAEEHFQSAAADGGNAARLLADFINRRASRAQWVRRLPDGSGQSLEDGRTLAAETFPLLFIAPATSGSAEARLILDYLGWLAPWLLLLDTLSHEQRLALEQQARMRAAEMVKQHRLYPRLADPAQLRAAQVEMALRHRRPEGADVAHTSMSPFYIELNPASGEYN